ncbi:hypothetical protein [Nitrincola iocasae]|uniref:Uncharacterized protein n=1 Tax=Nitrincola iocasae TaxID=2614693 RepID=A0A5J6LDR0_9GAMM|nr:hypothetical protein [Nitrincola iocasae]QEW06372.1 hypothetical protein F5I99_07550 [Nitrincola iocasae]
MTYQSVIDALSSTKQRLLTMQKPSAPIDEIVSMGCRGCLDATAPEAQRIEMANLVLEILNLVQPPPRSFPGGTASRCE